MKPWSALRQLQCRSESQRDFLLKWTSCVLVILATVGCSSVIKGTRSAGAVPANANQLLAGAAKLDITPPPGYPLGGHSIAATIGRGVWTRLSATAIYLQDARGSNLVLVSCDLWGMPAGLVDKVAERVSEDPKGKIVGRQSIIMAATHTHQSPGNFSSSPAYNALASPQMGFDSTLFEYFSDRISQCVIQAISTAQSATLTFVVQTNLFAQPDGLLIARNRSMPAFILDPECKSTLEENSWVPLSQPSSEYPDPRSSRAVDPRLRVLRITGRQGLVALVGFLAMHNTTMSHDTEVYDSDVFGAAETLAEQSLRDNGINNPIVALFNGPEGDISPMWSEQDRATCLNLAKRIADALVDQKPNAKAVDDEINSFFSETTISGRDFLDEHGEKRRTSEYAEGGAALVAGAEDGRTIFNYDGHVEGSRFTQIRSSTEGDKLDMLALGFPVNLPVQIKALPSKLLGVPKTVPLGVARVGNVLFATLPGEFTTSMGKRIEIALKRGHPEFENVVLLGLANEYLSYFTTPEEYDSQQYEGASTLYGPASAPFVQNQLVQLTAKMAVHAPDEFPLNFRYNAGPKSSFIPPKEINSLYNADDGLADILEDTVSHLPYRHFPRVSWTDRWQLLLVSAKTGRPTVPRVWIEAQDANGSWHPLKVHQRDEDNTGLDFVTAFIVSDPQHLTWSAFWMPPKGVDKTAHYRFCAATDHGVINSPFQIPDDCPLNPIM